MGFHSLESHFKLQTDANQSSPKPIVVVGDRLLTDIAYGNMNGCYSILVTDILDEKADNPAASIVRE